MASDSAGRMVPPSRVTGEVSAGPLPAGLVSSLSMLSM